MRMIPVSQHLLMFIIMSFLPLNRTQSTIPVSPAVEPCNNYKVLDDPWRATNNQYTFNMKCDAYVNWVGWYRLFIYNQSVQMPDRCVDQQSCGTQIPMWLSGGHPTVEDGVVTRDVCGHWNNKCCYFSFKITVKACPGNYSVYKLINPERCHMAYCADVRNITNITVPTEMISTEAPTVDPCNSYTALNDSWRSTSNTPSYHCDSDINWVGWYRLFIQGQSAQMPDTCAADKRCHTYASLWLNGKHPKVEDGVVTRHVCAHYPEDCCYLQFYPLKVKACPGNYYVYKFVRPVECTFAYCAEVSSNDTSYTTAPVTISTASSTLTSMQEQKSTVIGLQLRATTILDLTQNGNIQIFLDNFKQELISRGLPNTFELKLRRDEKIKP